MAEAKFFQMGRTTPNPLDDEEHKTSIVVHETAVQSHVDAGWFLIGPADDPSPPAKEAPARAEPKGKFQKE